MVAAWIDAGHVIFDAMYIGMISYVGVCWFRWVRESHDHGWRDWMTVAGFALSTLSLGLIVFLTVHSTLTDNYAPYSETLGRIYAAGIVSAITATTAALVGTGRLGKPTALTSFFCLLIWLASAVAM